MNAYKNQHYMAPCSEILSMDLEGITCSSPGGNGDATEGQLSLPVPGDLLDDPILLEDLLQQ